MAYSNFEVSVLGVGVIIEPEVMLRNCLVMPFISVKQNNTNRIIFWIDKWSSKINNFKINNKINFI